MSDWTLAIDFGTSYTAAAIGDGGGVAMVELDGSPRIPSLVLYRDGEFRIGRAAAAEAVVAPAAVERCPKRRLGAQKHLILDDEPVRTVELVAAVLRAVAEEARRTREGSTPASVVLTHPARWEEGSPRLQALLEAASLAGLGDEVRLCPEPVAAALSYADARAQPGQLIAVYDFGGGTFDTAVIRRLDDGGFELVGVPGGDEQLGGEDLDHRLYRWLGKQIEIDEPDTWEAIEHHQDVRWRRASASLRDGARGAKEILSKASTARVWIPEIARELVVNADQLRDLILPDLRRSVEIMAETTAMAEKLTGQPVERIYLVGGSSRIPLVQVLIEERFGPICVTWENPKDVVAKGAAQAARLESRARAAAPAEAGAAPPEAAGTVSLPGAARPDPAHSTGAVATVPARSSAGTRQDVVLAHDLVDAVLAGGYAYCANAGLRQISRVDLATGTVDRQLSTTGRVLRLGASTAGVVYFEAQLPKAFAGASADVPRAGLISFADERLVLRHSWRVNLTDLLPVIRVGPTHAWVLFEHKLVSPRRTGGAFNSLPWGFLSAPAIRRINLVTGAMDDSPLESSAWWLLREGGEMRRLLDESAAASTSFDLGDPGGTRVSGVLARLDLNRGKGVVRAKLTVSRQEQILVTLGTDSGAQITPVPPATPLYQHLWSGDQDLYAGRAGLVVGDTLLRPRPPKGTCRWVLTAHGPVGVELVDAFPARGTAVCFGARPRVVLEDARGLLGGLAVLGRDPAVVADHEGVWVALGGGEGTTHVHLGPDGSLIRKVDRRGWSWPLGTAAGRLMVLESAQPGPGQDQLRPPRLDLVAVPL